MKGYGATSRRIYSRGRPSLVLAMEQGPQERPQWQARRKPSDDPRWKHQPVQGSAEWRRQTGADRRARRVKLLLILIAALVGAAVALI